MYFESVSAALHMDGHGTYVWAAYGVALIVIVWSLVNPLRRHRQVFTRIATEQRALATNTTSESESL